jgi:apolipoprotein N-acyltransferase
VSAIIDQRGKILSRSPQFETYVLSGKAAPHSGATPYAQTGNLPVILLVLAARRWPV